MRINLQRGLDIGLNGAPVQRFEGTLSGSRVALQTHDYKGLRPRLTVATGDRVRVGDALFHDRREPSIAFTSPASGRVVDIRRGAKRRLLEVVIAREGRDAVAFPAHSIAAICHQPVDELRDILLRSGMWTALRARPRDSVASPATRPRALFVTAVDTRPHAPDPSIVLQEQAEAFVAGIKALSRLPSGSTYVCVAPDSAIPVPECKRVERYEFAGPHPAGLPGTHLHAVGLAVTRDADLWHVGYQDVAAIGHLLLSGAISSQRVIALSGPGARRPRLLHAVPGTELQQLSDEWRDVPGSVVSGSALDGNPDARYLGRYHSQVTLLPAAPVPASGKLGALFRHIVSGQAAVNIRGNRCGMLPLEAFEAVWPYRSSPQPLLRALLASDLEAAERYGCLGLAEEDLALCGYVCPGRNDYGTALRRTLDAIEAEG